MERRPCQGTPPANERTSKQTLPRPWSVRVRGRFRRPCGSCAAGVTVQCRTGRCGKKWGSGETSEKFQNFLRQHRHRTYRPPSPWLPSNHAGQHTLCAHTCTQHTALHTPHCTRHTALPTITHTGSASRGLVSPSRRTTHTRASTTHLARSVTVPARPLFHLLFSLFSFFFTFH